eukprot:gene18638-25153_t
MYSPSPTGLGSTNPLIRSWCRDGATAGSASPVHLSGMVDKASRQALLSTIERINEKLAQKDVKGADEQLSNRGFCYLKLGQLPNALKVAE